MSEARHCLRKLAVPFFHHEVVKQALLRCMEEEEDSSNEESLVKLLKQLSSTGDISDSQMARVISRLLCCMHGKLPVTDCTCMWCKRLTLCVKFCP